MTAARDVQVSTRFVIPVADWFAVLACLAFATNILELLLAPQAADGTGSPLVRVTYLAVYAFAMVLLVGSGAFPGAFFRFPLLLAVLAWPAASVLWSIMPVETVERLLGLFGCSALGIFLGWQHSLRHIVRTVAWSLLAATMLSVLAITLLPSIGIDQSGGPWTGTWIGIHAHKNGLGSTACIAVLFLLFAALGASGWQRRAFAAGVALAALLLIGSRSTTALLVCAVCLLLAAALLLARRMPSFACLVLLVLAVLLPVLAAMVVQMELIPKALAWLGKDEDLSSRLPLWRLLWPFIEDRFWLGYGYGVFWLPDLPWVDLIEARLNFAPFYAHNGVLELWLGGGLILVLLMGALFLASFGRALLYAVSRPTQPESVLPLVFLVYLALQNFSEATLLMRNDVTWAIFLSITVHGGRLVGLRLRFSSPRPGFKGTAVLDATYQA